MLMLQLLLIEHHLHSRLHHATIVACSENLLWAAPKGSVVFKVSSYYSYPMPILSSRHASIQEELITCVNFTSIPHKYCTIFMWDGNCVNRPLLSSKLISDGHTSNILHSLILFPDLHPAFVGSSVIVLWFSMYRSVPQIRPPFCNLSLSTKRRGGLYTGCDDFSRDYALPSSTGKAWPHCQWGVGAKREVERCSRR